MVEVENRTFTTAAKSGKRKRCPSPVRERCIGFIKILRKMGYDKTIALGEAFELFRSEVGIMDLKSSRAYFGTRAGKSKRIINMRKLYQNGEQSFRTIELSSDIVERRGYFEIFGLVDFEKKGNAWFMNLKRDFLVPQCNPQPSESRDRVDVDVSGVISGEVSKVEVSLCSNEEDDNVCVVSKILSSSTLELEYIHTTQEKREKSSLEKNISPKRWGEC
jgi:hypothetical protein